MTPEDLAQAAADADADLAALAAAGVEPGTLESALKAQRDRYSDLECESGAALIAELADLSDGDRQALAQLTQAERIALDADRD